MSSLTASAPARNGEISPDIEPGGLVIAGRKIRSRLLVGTGKFSSNQAMADCLEASGTEIVTVALRRADLTGKDDPYADILHFIDPEKISSPAQHQRRHERRRSGAAGAAGRRRRACPNG